MDEISGVFTPDVEDQNVRGTELIVNDRLRLTCVIRFSLNVVCHGLLRIEAAKQQTDYLLN